jgi:hypothetical protein
VQGWCLHLARTARDMELGRTAVRLALLSLVRLYPPISICSLGVAAVELKRHQPLPRELSL